MKTLPALTVALALLAPLPSAAAQPDTYLQDFQRQQELEAKERRLRELEARQREEQRRRDAIERHRTNPLLSEKERRMCKPGQQLC